jgi:hypothetical protein
VSRAARAQLARVRTATARYRNIANAIADGYADINVVLPNMGAHYLKSGLMDANFDVERPELLVYSQDKNGKLIHRQRGRMVREPDLPALDASCMGLETESGRRV